MVECFNGIEEMAVRFCPCPNFKYKIEPYNVNNYIGSNMFYLIYQIRNKTNNKIYIGKHQTNNKNDEYMGSGKYLRYAIVGLSPTVEANSR